MKRIACVVVCWSALGWLACAEPPPKVSGASPAAVDAGADAEAAEDEDLVADEPTSAESVPPPPPTAPPDYHARAVKAAAAVFRNLQPSFRACYAKRLAAKPRAHGSVVVDVLIGPGGEVRSVDTTGGAILGDDAMSCIVDKVRSAKFDPPHGGGTLRIKVPFSFRVQVKTVDGGADGGGRP